MFLLTNHSLWKVFVVIVPTLYNLNREPTLCFRLVFDPFREDITAYCSGFECLFSDFTQKLVY